MYIHCTYEYAHVYICIQISRQSELCITLAPSPTTYALALGVGKHLPNVFTYLWLAYTLMPLIHMYILHIITYVQIVDAELREYAHMYVYIKDMYIHVGYVHVHPVCNSTAMCVL